MQNLRLTERGGIDGIRRIPASVLAAVQRTTADVLARRTLHAPFRVLKSNQLREYEVRRRALLARVDEAVREYGRERVVLDDSDRPIARVFADSAAPVTPVESSPAAPASERRHRRHHRHDDAAEPSGERHHRRHRRHHHDDDAR